VLSKEDEATCIKLLSAQAELIQHDKDAVFQLESRLGRQYKKN
jgi:hypothetical protein